MLKIVSKFESCEKVYDCSFVTAHRSSIRLVGNTISKTPLLKDAFVLQTTALAPPLTTQYTFQEILLTL